jgi:hypothetical protein
MLLYLWSLKSEVDIEEICLLKFEIVISPLVIQVLLLSYCNVCSYFRQSSLDKTLQIEKL